MEEQGPLDAADELNSLRAQLLGGWRGWVDGVECERGKGLEAVRGSAHMCMCARVLLCGRMRACAIVCARVRVYVCARVCGCT